MKLPQFRGHQTSPPFAAGLCCSEKQAWVSERLAMDALPGPKPNNVVITHSPPSRACGALTARPGWEGFHRVHTFPAKTAIGRGVN